MSSMRYRPGFGGGDGHEPHVFAHDVARQRGGGIGSVFSNIYSTVVPIVRSALKSRVGKSLLKDAKNTALQAGLNVVGDALDGKNVIKATKQRVKTAKTNFKKKVAKRLDAGLEAFANPQPKKKNVISTPKKRKRIAATRRSLTASRAAKRSRTLHGDLFTQLW